MATNLDGICEIIAVTFEIPVEAVNEDSSSQTIEQWDSIAHINMVMELEQKYGVAFTMEEIAEMHDVRIICKVIDQKSAKGGKS